MEGPPEHYYPLPLAFYYCTKIDSLPYASFQIGGLIVRVSLFFGEAPAR